MSGNDPRIHSGYCPAAEGRECTCGMGFKPTPSHNVSSDKSGFPVIGQLRQRDAARAMEILSKLTGNEWTSGMGVYFCGRQGMMCATATDPVPAIRRALLASGKHVRVIVEYIAAHARQPASVRVNTMDWHWGNTEEDAFVRALLADYPEASR